MQNGKGAMWNNKRRTNPKAPHFTGHLETPDGKKWYVAGWSSDGQAGRPVVQLTCTEFKQPPIKGAQAKVLLTDDISEHEKDDIPF